jgi:hypothetical protein
LLCETRRSEVSHISGVSRFVVSGTNHSILDRDQPSKNGQKILEPLNNPEHNPADIVLLLFIHGIRTNVFTKETLPEILAASQTTGGTVQYRPEARKRAVICQIENSVSRLLLDNVATNSIINDSLQLAADAAGLRAAVGSHDLKRGYTRDYVYAAPVNYGTARRDVAQQVNHGG